MTNEEKIIGLLTDLTKQITYATATLDGIRPLIERIDDDVPMRDNETGDEAALRLIVRGSEFVTINNAEADARAKEILGKYGLAD